MLKRMLKKHVATRLFVWRRPQSWRKVEKCLNGPKVSQAKKGRRRALESSKGVSEQQSMAKQLLHNSIYVQNLNEIFRVKKGTEKTRTQTLTHADHAHTHAHTRTRTHMHTQTPTEWIGLAVLLVAQKMRSSRSKKGENVCNPKINKNSFSLSRISLLCDLISENGPFTKFLNHH